MVSYEIYKILHLVSMFLLLTGLSISFYLANPPRLIKMLTGIGTLLTFVAGMGLMARLGVPHGEPWPLWIKLKMTIWMLIGIGGAIIVRRFPQFGRMTYGVVLVLFLAAATSAVYKF